jgi:hypothetical protein
MSNRLSRQRKIAGQLRGGLRVASMCLTGLALAGGSPPAAVAEGCPFTARRAGSFAMTENATVRIDCPWGAVRVEGAAENERVEVEGVACASSAALLEQVGIGATEGSDGLSIAVAVPVRPPAAPHKTTSDPVLGDSSSLDLVVRVPSRARLVVSHDYGTLEIRHVAAASVRSGLGDLRVQGVAGPVEIEDGLGEIVVLQAGSDVRITDGPGDLVVKEVGGSVRLEDNPQGDLIVEEVRGSVLVRNNGRGDVLAADVGGDLTVEKINGGEVRHRNVAGKVRLPDGVAE